ncbi:MAG TPA: hypothetical protein VJ727_01580 [Rhodanobacteraceae bacterium]|nr:hypothetical protein [Rhodanobacteraceae bacterium]
MLKRLFAAAALILAISAAHSGNEQSADENFRVLPTDEAATLWQMDEAHKQAPHFVRDVIKAHAEGCVAVAYEIHADGSVSNARVLKDSWSKLSPEVIADQERAVTDAALKWQFIPADANKDRIPVYTYKVVSFITGDNRYTVGMKAYRQKLKSQCEMPDFVQRVQQAVAAHSSLKPKP